MRRLLTCVLLGVLLIAAVSSSRVLGQEDEVTQQKAAEFARLYERWKESQKSEEKITVGERALDLTPTLKEWPLQIARDRLKGELWFGLGGAYFGRTQGDRADNLERAIA